MQRLSLTSKLAIAFALTGFLTLYGLGVYLEHVLSSQLVEQDDDEIVLKAQHVRDLLVRTENSVPISDISTMIEHQFGGNDAFIIQVRDIGGNALINLDPSNLSPQLQMPVTTNDTVSEGNIHPLDEHQVIRGLSVILPARNGEQLTLVVARAMHDRERMISEYRQTIIGSVLLGALALMISGFVMVRHAIRPLKEMAIQAASITANRLDARLSISDAPPELESLANSLNAMLARIDDGFHRLSAFTADLAHDLRTPITNLRGQTEVALSRTRDVEEYQALLGSNLEEYQRLSRMIESILFLARADNAQVAIRPVRIDLLQALENIADYFSDLAEESGLRFSIEAAGEVWADSILFQRAVGNLISNAIKHTQPGSAIHILAFLEAEMVVVEIVNPGEEISTQHLSHLFERFYRADTARSNSGESMGLGLAIVHSIMELHGGKCDVSSAKGLTIFSLYFPTSTHV
jgi:two-component system heavy metal sensor histidine kinase CusS